MAMSNGTTPARKYPSASTTTKPAPVFPYGSVPLRTYLPDGDIDLTVVSTTSDQKVMAQKVRAILEEEEKNEAAIVRVKNIKFIDAQVKLVKCTVQDIAIDISFNQLGGLSALCFLEEIDRYLGREHLFKRSLLLIKSWCFYEGHVLGAYRGFLSTYALEIMVVYIFELFSQYIRWPLMALHLFLDYFSQFDWDARVINLRGPEFVPGNLFFCDKFLSWCMDTYSVPRKDLASDSRMFQYKPMKIVDPLQPHNNLGRSVNLENSWMICRVLAHGAQELYRILHLPRDRIAGEVRNFLTSGMRRHSGSGNSPVDISSLNAAGTDSAENRQVWRQTLLGLGGDHDGNMKNLKDAYVIHGYNSVAVVRPYLGGTAWVPVPPYWYTHNPVPVPPTQAPTFSHPAPRRRGSCLGGSQRPLQGMGSYVPQQNASSSNGNSSEWRGKENVTENRRQGKSLAQRNGHVVGPKKKSPEKGIFGPSKSDSAQTGDGSVYDAGSLPKIQFGSFADTFELTVQPETKFFGRSARSSEKPVKQNSNAESSNQNSLSQMLMERKVACIV